MKTIIFALAILTFTSYGQTKKCKQFILVDKSNFNPRRVSNKGLSPSITFKKSSHSVSISTQDSNFIFKDFYNKDMEDYEFTYEIIGEDTTRKWVLTKGQDLHRDYFYLIHTDNNKIDSLVGRPVFYGDFILCLEGSYTDGGEKIELWKVSGKDIVKVKTFNPHKCEIYGLSQIYLTGTNIFFSTSDKYYRVDVGK